MTSGQQVTVLPLKMQYIFKVYNHLRFANNLLRVLVKLQNVCDIGTGDRPLYKEKKLSQQRKLLNQQIHYFTLKNCIRHKGQCGHLKTFICKHCVNKTYQQYTTIGDSRVNDSPFLGGNHLMFVREHNQIVGKLQKVNPRWSAFRLYQEARKIIGALLQQITYREFLPSILRKQDLEKFNLELYSSGFSNSYRSNINPATKNVFSAAAFRFGHTLVSYYEHSKTLRCLEM